MNMVSMFASCAVDRGFEPSSNVLPIDYNKIAGYLLFLRYNITLLYLLRDSLITGQLQHYIVILIKRFIDYWSVTTLHCYTY